RSNGCSGSRRNRSGGRAATGAHFAEGDLLRARKTKADRFLWFDEMPSAAVYNGAFNAPMLWNSNFFTTLESVKILRVLTDVWLSRFQIRAWPQRDDAGEDAMVLGDGDAQH